MNTDEMKRVLLLLVALPLVACCVGEPAASDADLIEPIELVGHIGGMANAVSAQGGYLYAGFGAELAILDISNPTRPERVGYVVQQGVIGDIAVSDDHAYVLLTSPYDHVDAGGLRVVDVSDPNAPFQVREMGFSGTTVEIAGQYAYVGDGQVVRVMDIADPASPDFVGRYTASENVAGVEAADNCVYVVWCAPDARGECVRGGLDVVDISRPRSPKRVIAVELPIPVGDPVELVGDHLYIADRHSGLHLVDVTHPDKPVYAGTLGMGERPEAIVIHSDRAYVAGVYGGLVVLDVSAPDAPDEISSHSILQAGSTDVTIVGDYAYVANGSAGGLRVVDISDSVAVVGGYGGPGLAVHVTAVDEYVYVANHEGAFWIVDLSDPARPTEVGFHPARFEGHPYGLGLAVLDGYAYVAVGNSVRVIDISHPPTPVEIGARSVSVSAIHGLAARGDYLYVAAEVAGPRCRPDGGFRVLDVSDPADMREVGGLDVDFGALENVVVQGDYAYVAGWTGLLIVDVSDPVQPTVADSHYTPGNAHNVAVVAGDLQAHPHAYVADGYFGLRTFDVSTPTAVVDRGSYGIATVTRDVAAGKGHIYVSNDLEGLWVLDVSIPAAPAKPRSFYVPGQPRVAAVGEWIYLLEPAGGLYLLRVP